MAPLIQVGLVTDARWYDINGDSEDDLLLTGEWMPLTIILQKDGNFVEATDAYGLSNTTGWWNTLEVADLDDDGDADIIAGNIGQNYKFHASAEKPFHVFSEDFDSNGTYDIYLAKTLRG